MNTEQARTNMIKQQIRTNKVLDEAVLAAIESIPRENFVPPALKHLAYADMPLPLPHNQQMLTPLEEAVIVQAARLRPQDTILEIGTGTGYATALLAKLAAFVFSVDIFADFTTQAQNNLTQHGISNVTLFTADAASGWHEQAPYDAIIISGSLPLFPTTLRDDLKVGGRLFCIVGEAPAMTAMLVTRTGRNEWQQTSLFETTTPALINAPQKNAFEF